MSRDHKVSFLPESSIARIARQLRYRARIDHLANFDVVDLTKRLTRTEIPFKGFLRIEFLSPTSERSPAYVDYNPTTLHVDKEVWELAELGSPDERFILGHELGHVILHDHTAQAFSVDPSKKLNFVQNEESAEWQAHKFLGHLFLPDHIVRAFGHVQLIAQKCGVNVGLAKERLETVFKFKPPLTRYEGDACDGCGNFTLVRNGTCLKCDTCGATTGCS